MKVQKCRKSLQALYFLCFIPALMAFKSAAKVQDVKFNTAIFFKSAAKVQDVKPINTRL